MKCKNTIICDFWKRKLLTVVYSCVGFQHKKTTSKK